MGFGKTTWVGFYIACTICLLVICSKHALYVAGRKYFYGSNANSFFVSSFMFH